MKKLPENLRKLMGIALVLISLSCDEQNKFQEFEIDCIPPESQPTNTITQVLELYKFGTPDVIDEDMVIEGVVISSDKEGNMYKTITIQDARENPTAGLKIAIDQSHLYTRYEVGRKIRVRLKGLSIGYGYGSIQLGKLKDGGIDGIPGFDLNDHLIRTCDYEEVIPKKISFNSDEKPVENVLLTFENIQFNTMELKNTMGELHSTESVTRSLDQFDEQCGYLGSVIMENSGFADFKHKPIPEKMGQVTGIVENRFGGQVLVIRNYEDIDFEKERCDYAASFSSSTTLKEVRAMYAGSRVEFGISNNFIFHGYVISDNSNGNFTGELFVQDASDNPDAGIRLLIDDALAYNSYSSGEEVFIDLSGLYMDVVDDILSIGIAGKKGIEPIPYNTLKTAVFKTGDKAEIVPRELTLNDLDNENFKSTLVTVNAVQLETDELGSAFTYFSGDLDGYRTLEVCGEQTKITVFTTSTATFAKDIFPEGKGSITGIISDVIKIRSLEDINFDKSREECPEWIPQLFITEVADPVNSVASRYVELYNAGKKSVNLSGWKLNKYVNGSEAVSGSGEALHGTIEPGGYFIIANTEYKYIYNDTPDVESTYISGNGDDVYALADNTDTVIDVFGIIGEDGNEKSWEYLDGRASRQPDVTQASKVFKREEWIIYTKADNRLTDHPKTARFAPENFDPRTH